MTETTDGTKKWRRSTHCSDGTCVEVAVAGDRILVRDGKNPEQPHLGFDRDSWAQFVAEIKGDRYPSL